MRVATKYVNLTRRFFAEKGVADYRIVESLGATEGAPGAGAAELIVDITTTGATLAANALKILDDGVILRSEANLVASIGAPGREARRAAARTVLTRIAAEEEARTTGRSAPPSTPRGPNSRRSPDEPAPPCPTASAGGNSCSTALPRTVFDLVAALRRSAPTTSRCGAVDYLFRATNPLTERLSRSDGLEVEDDGGAYRQGVASRCG